MSPPWSHDTASHDGKTTPSPSPVPNHQDYDDAEKGICESVTVLESPSPSPPPPPRAFRAVDGKLIKRGGPLHRLDTLLRSPTSPTIHEGITPSPSLPELSLAPELHLPWPESWQQATITKVPETVAKFDEVVIHEEREGDSHSEHGGKKQGGNGSRPASKQRPADSKPKIKTSKWILFKLWFNTYRKFFTFVTLLNLTGIILAACGKFEYAENHLGALVLGNLLMAILMRNELFLRIVYVIVIYGLRSWAPLWLKLAITSVLQHVGGIHSGCALSGACWLVYKVVDIILHRATQPDAVLATGVITNVFVIISVLSAFPWVRNNHHNAFERHHRFIGWLGLATTWVFVILGNSYDIKLGEWRADANSLLSAQEFWFAVFMTIFVLIPWFTLREVPVEVEIPSPKVAILKFKRGMQQGLLGRISRTSLMEYHVFGIISEGRKADCHYMICGVQGDFTKELVAKPPKTIWTRELKFAGVGHASAMYKRGIRICTGTGIGAALATCIQSKNWFLIWIGSDQEKTFGPTISGLIYKHIEPERMILWDSKKRGGRPDTVQLLKDTWHSFEAEVIFITSNMQGNDEMMRGCAAAGLHAFGTLWDF